MKTLSARLFSALLTAVLAAPSLAAARSETVEILVEGLNCTLCSDAMKASLKKSAGALDLEPRLECGRIYVEMPVGARVNEGAVNFTLLANGFNLKGVQPSAKSLADVRASKTC